MEALRVVVQRPADLASRLVPELFVEGRGDALQLVREDRDTAQESAVHHEPFAAVGLVAKRNGLSNLTLKEASKDSHAAPAHEQAIERVERVVSRRAVDGPLRAEPFRGIEHLFDDDPGRRR